ncbi:ATP-binding cassette domain-containing protein [Paenibacillus sp. N4]|uniref:ATP-binding cassette domain-containing protein n=1 Tax=Paenibacillus vietnamensis TaxID=2590547 RepID=UPI001CD13158|nr:ATP-binding cassette domain-containing protein [Paenibacillus vietnamensis]MCA0757898.1 ATP-binding cassette domain-containing protein [Paenibacillus vietnamensis]
MTVRIVLSDVEYSSGKTKLITGASCAMSTGITYVIGKNGAGKSTLLKLIATAAVPDRGSVVYTRLINEDGAGMYRKQLGVEEVRGMLGYMPQHFTGQTDMTVEKYLKYMALHKGIPRRLVKPSLEKWLTESGLAELKGRKLRSLSGGQLRKVGFLQAVMNHPRICVLDEPFEGLDSVEKLFFKRTINRLAFHSIVVMSTHLLEEMDPSEDNSLLCMEDGKLSYRGSVEEAGSLFPDEISDGPVHEKYT